MASTSPSAPYNPELEIRPDFSSEEWELPVKAIIASLRNDGNDDARTRNAAIQQLEEAWDAAHKRKVKIWKEKRGVSPQTRTASPPPTLPSSTNCSQIDESPNNTAIGSAKTESGNDRSENGYVSGNPQMHTHGPDS